MPKKWSSAFCLACEHFYWQNYGACKAFPKGIPHVIASNEVDHFTPLVGQKNDLVFKQKKGRRR